MKARKPCEWLQGCARAVSGRTYLALRRGPSFLHASPAVVLHVVALSVSLNLNAAMRKVPHELALKATPIHEFVGSTAMLFAVVPLSIIAIAVGIRDYAMTLWRHPIHKSLPHVYPITMFNGHVFSQFHCRRRRRRLCIVPAEAMVWRGEINQEENGALVGMMADIVVGATSNCRIMSNQINGKPDSKVEN
jgi:hypothetical protein